MNNDRRFHHQADIDAAKQIELLTEIRDLLKAAIKERPAPSSPASDGAARGRGRRKQPSEN